MPRPVTLRAACRTDEGARQSGKAGAAPTPARSLDKAIRHHGICRRSSWYSVRRSGDLDKAARAPLQLKATDKTQPSPTWSLPDSQSFRYLEDLVEALADQLLQRVALGSGEDSKKYMVGITGPPGGGKSTLTLLIERQINMRASLYGLDRPASVVPMDGFHFSRKQLDAMDDPVEAHARRGAHWTFDAEGFVACLKKIAREGGASCPSFDHGAGDPVEDDIIVNFSHRIILVEGNYLLLDLPPWTELREVLDETWFVDTDLDVAMERIFKRQTGIGMAPEISRGRILGNDRPNGELIMETRSAADMIIPALPMRPG